MKPHTEEAVRDVLDAIRSKTRFFRPRGKGGSHLPHGSQSVPSEAKLPLSEWAKRLETSIDDLGIPPEPREGQQHRASHEFWERMYGGPVRLIEPRFEFERRQLNRLGRGEYSGTNSGLQRTVTRAHETSLNWSGAYISPRDGRMFSEVHASWKVPKVKPPTNHPADAEYDSSAWIGLDGQRRYRDSSLPQIGTSHHVTVSKYDVSIGYTAWWQWWLRDDWNPPPVVIPLTVRPDDEILCSLYVVSETEVKFVIKNQCTGDLCIPFVFPQPKTYLDEPRPAGPSRVSGATAQWVLERPTKWGTEASKDGPELYDLPNYGTIEFTDCLATSALAPGEDGREETLVGSRVIDMYSIERDPPRTVVISEAERLDDRRIQMTYRERLPARRSALAYARE